MFNKISQKTISELYKIQFVIFQIYKAGPWTLFSSLFITLLSGLSPLLTSWSISEICRNLECRFLAFNDSFFWLAFLLLVNILNFYMANIKNALYNITGIKLAHSIENLVACKFQKISQSKMDDPYFLDLYQNTLDKSTYEPLNVSDSLFSMLSSIFGIAGYILIFLKFDYRLMLLLVASVFPALYIKLKLNKSYYRFVKQSTTDTRKIWYYFSLMTTPENANEVRVFNLYDHFKLKRKKLFDKFVNTHHVHTHKFLIYMSICCVLVFSAIAFSEFYLLKLAISKSISISEFVFYAPSFISFEFLILNLVDVIASNNRSLLFLDSLFEFLNSQETVFNLPKNDTLPKLTDDFIIEFKNVSFKYPGSSVFALKNINLKIEFGKSICLVGENGSGKSTFLKLLLRVYTPQDGTIFLNGININNYDIEAYRKLFGVVLQNYIKYYFDVKTCIGLGNVENVDNIDKIKAVASITHADDFIKKYSKQYNTNLGKNFYADGIEPSGGQWQKLAISRAMYSDAPILILDEPTSSLDPKAEDEIFKVFTDASKYKIMILVSHRMYSARLASKVVLFDDGEIVACGSHSELMEKCKKYNEMFNLQASKYR